MRKLYEIFKLLWIQKRIVAAATIWGNTVFEKKILISWEVEWFGLIRGIYARFAKKMADSSQLILSLILVWGRLQSPGYFTFLWKSWYLQCDWSPNKYRCIFTKSGQLWNICTQNTSKAVSKVTFFC